MPSPTEIAAVAAARADGATAERERISAIVNCPEAKGKAQSAIKLALTPGMSLDSAKGFLTGRAPLAGSTAALASAVAKTNQRRPSAASDGPSVLAAVVAKTNQRPSAG